MVTYSLNKIVEEIEDRQSLVFKKTMEAVLACPFIKGKRAKDYLRAIAYHDILNKVERTEELYRREV